jgi:hypothetical protein
MKLARKNEYGLPAGAVYLQRVYDPETGRRLRDRITSNNPGDPLLLSREYDPKTGKIRKETRP